MKNLRYLTENLEELNFIKNFNAEIYSLIKSHINGKVLETGSGLGRFSKLLLKDFPDTELSDIDKKYLTTLKKLFPKNPVYLFDIGLRTNYENINKFDTIICMNVLEHVKDDMLALRELRRITNFGGKLILIVPCYKWLFNSLDKSVLHFRRYSKLELLEKAQKTGWHIECVRHFNFIGIFGWILSGIAQSKVFNPRAIRLFDVLFPLSRFIELVLLKETIGLCIFAVLKNLHEPNQTCKNELD